MSSDEITKKIHFLERNYVDLSQEIARIRSLLEDKEKLRPLFLESSATRRTFGKEVDEIIQGVQNNTSRTLDIMGYFDNNFVSKLEPCAERIRIIGSDRATKTKSVRTALERLLKARAEIRYNEELHARIILSNDAVIIGSGDLQASCLAGNRIDACIWSNHPDILKSSREFFSRIWNESKPSGDTTILYNDFESYTIGSSPYEPFKIYKSAGEISVTDQISGSDKCLKISSPNESTDFILYEFRECTKVKIQYKIRQESFNEKGIGACLHVFHTPVKETHPILDENEAIHMAISDKKIYDYDNKPNYQHQIRAKIWYNIELNIDCKTKSYTYKVNGKPYNGYFRNPLDTVNAIITTPWTNQPEWSTYFDNISITKIE